MFRLMNSGQLSDIKKEWVIQNVLNAFQKPNYLEIGVQSGVSLNAVRAHKKWAVDPKFKPQLKQIIQKNKKRFPIFRKEWFFQMTSDEFFSKEASRLRRERIDVAFVDGLHTFDQSMRDVMHCLQFLREDGAILIHDCSPTTEAMAWPAASYETAAEIKPPGWTKEWCGDVWKTVVYLRSFRPDLRVFVLDCDYGVGVVSKGEAESTLDFTIEQIKDFSYADLDQNRAEWLNLKSPDFLERFLKEDF